MYTFSDMTADTSTHKSNYSATLNHGICINSTEWGQNWMYKWYTHLHSCHVALPFSGLPPVNLPWHWPNVSSLKFDAFCDCGDKKRDRRWKRAKFHFVKVLSESNMCLSWTTEWTSIGTWPRKLKLFASIGINYVSVQIQRNPHRAEKCAD